MKRIEIVIATDQDSEAFKFTEKCLRALSSEINTRANSGEPYKFLWRLAVPIGTVTESKVVEHVGERLDLVVTAELDWDVLESADTKIKLNEYVGTFSFIPRETVYEDGMAIHKSLTLDSIGIIHRSQANALDLPAIKVLSDSTDEPSSAVRG